MQTKQKKNNWVKLFLCMVFFVIRGFFQQGKSKKLELKYFFFLLKHERENIIKNKHCTVS